jgi:diacylglycerol kinase (ATP)
MIPQKSANLFASFRHAIAGLSYAIRTQRNARVHLLVTILVVALAAWAGLSEDQWCLLLLAIGLVWMAELSNTAIETAVDLASPEYHPLAKTAKDVKAGAVLVTAFISILVGLFLLGPALLHKLGTF